MAQAVASGFWLLSIRSPRCAEYAVPLTVLAWHADHRGPDAKDYLDGVALAEEDAQRAVPRRAQQRPQLRAEQIRTRQAETQSAQPLPVVAPSMQWTPT